MIDDYSALQTDKGRRGINSVLIVVVTFNAQDWITTFIDRSSGIDPKQFLIIDNGSTDHTIYIIKSCYRDIKLIQAEYNMGFGGGNNIGLRYAVEAKYDFVFLLNQDAFITAAEIEKMVAIQQVTKAGIVSPMQYFTEGVLDRQFETYLKRCNINAVTAKDKPHLPCAFVIAALWLVPTAVIKEVGGFDPIFYHYGEDNDYVNRVKFHGHDLVVATQAEGYHLRDQSLPSRTDKELINAAQRRCIIVAKDINLSGWEATVKFCRTIGSQMKRYFFQKGVGFFIRLFISQLKVAGAFTKIAKHRKLSETVGGGQAFYQKKILGQ